MTVEDLNRKLVSKREFKAGFAQMREEMLTKDDWSQLMTKIDRFFGIVQTLMQEKVVTDRQIKRIEDDVSLLKEHVGI